MKKIQTLSLIIILLICSLVTTSAQVIVLTPDAGLDVNAGPCTEIVAGTTLNFERGTGCDLDILITTNALPPVELLQTSAATTSYTFNAEGSFVVFCGATSGGAIATQAICVNVAPASASIPTLGEWGLIFLVLLFLIVGVIVARKEVVSKTSVS